MTLLNLDIHYFTNIKTKRLIGLLGVGAEILPIRLWCHCAEHHAENAELLGYSAEEIESLIAWRGTRGKAVAALLKVGFLDAIEHGFHVHDWLDYQGHIGAFKRRSRAANEIRWSSLRKPQDGILNAASRTPSDETGTPCDDTRIPAGATENSGRSPSGESRTPSDETRSPLTNQTNKPNQPSSLTYLNQPNQLLQMAKINPDQSHKDSFEEANRVRELIRAHAGTSITITEPNLKTLVALREKHGRSFERACEYLHPGVDNIVGYLRSMLEPSPKSRNGSP
jgi:hypothetical protein